MNVTSAAATEVATRALASQVATRISQSQVATGNAPVTPDADGDSDGSLGTLLDVRA